MERFKRPDIGDRDDRNRQFDQIVRDSPVLEAVLEVVERVASTTSTVLIQGETGTGKELIAKSIHNILLILICKIAFGDLSKQDFRFGVFACGLMSTGQEEERRDQK